jgi:hypothetical protein
LPVISGQLSAACAADTVPSLRLTLFTQFYFLESILFFTLRVSEPLAGTRNTINNSCYPHHACFSKKSTGFDPLRLF